MRYRGLKRLSLKRKFKEINKFAWPDPNLLTDPGTNSDRSLPADRGRRPPAAVRDALPSEPFQPTLAGHADVRGHRGHPDPGCPYMRVWLVRDRAALDNCGIGMALHAGLDDCPRLGQIGAL